MTYNIRLDTPVDGLNQWPNRKEKVAQLIQQQSPAIVGVQEALHHQMLDLEMLLPGFAWYGAGRDDGQEKGEFSAIFYRKDLFRATNSGTFWLSETPAVPGSKSWDAAITRVCSWVELITVDAPKLRFFVFNTHFDHVGQAARLHSMSLIAQKTKEIAGTSPFVLMGDFNCEPGSPPYEVARDKQRWQLTDAWLADVGNQSGQGKNPLHGCTFTGFEVAKAECRRIDYIFLGNGIKSVNCWHLPDNDGTYFPSDHLPVVAAVDF